MIRLQGISKVYTSKNAETLALKDVSLKIEKGEYIAVMGTSGSGKSTLLNIIGCMDQATSGTYWFDGLDVTGMSVRALHQFRKNNISFVFQNFALLNQYTVYENVELPLIARGVLAGKRKKIVLNELERVGILEQKDQLVKYISGGQQQRTAIARALAAQTKLLLADEPTGALDQKTTQDIMELFTALNREGHTIILVTHDRDVAEKTKRILRIEDGQITE